MTACRAGIGQHCLGARVLQSREQPAGGVLERTPDDGRRPVAGQDVKLAYGVRPQVDFRALDAVMAQPERDLPDVADGFQGAGRRAVAPISCTR